MQLSGSRGLSSAKISCGLIGWASRCARSVHQPPPALDLAFELRTPGAVVLALQQRHQRRQGVLGVPDQVALGRRVAHPQQPPVDVDLHRPARPLLGQPLGVGEARADHQQRVAAHHHVVAGLGAQQADRTGDEREIVRQRGPAIERFRDPRAQQLRHLDDLIGGVCRALADQDRHLLTGVENLGRALKVLVTGSDQRPAEPKGREHGAMSARRLLMLCLLDVLRHDHRGRMAGILGDADRPVDHVTRLRRVHDRHQVLTGHVLEQRVEIDLLLIVGSQRHPLLLADDRHHGLMVELGVIDAIEQMDRSRTRGRHADTDLARELGVCAGGKRGDLLVAGLDELDPVAHLVEGPDQPVDAVPGIPVDALHAPLTQPVQDELRSVRHEGSFVVGSAGSATRADPAAAHGGRFPSALKRNCKAVPDHRPYSVKSVVSNATRRVLKASSSDELVPGRDVLVRYPCCVGRAVADGADAGASPVRTLRYAIGSHDRAHPRGTSRRRRRR